MEVYSAPGRSKRERVLDFIRVSQAATGVPPTLREIADGLRMGYGTIEYHINALRDGDALAPVPRYTNRALQPTAPRLTIAVLGRSTESEAR